MNTVPHSYGRHRFPPEIISHAVWLYHRFCLSFRDVEEILAERGVIVTCGVPLAKTVMSLTSWSSVDETRALQGDSSGSC